jgi:pimeloyl-ACP methyl ester carboxylesterase
MVKKSLQNIDGRIRAFCIYLGSLDTAQVSHSFCLKFFNPAIIDQLQYQHKIIKPKNVQFTNTTVRLLFLRATLLSFIITIKKQGYLAALLLTTVIGLTGCHRQASNDMPAVTFETCTPPKGYTPIPESGCSFISVRENPDDPASNLIDVHFLRIKAVNANPQPDPLVLIQGGPGGSSQIMAYSLHRYFAAVRQNRDLLFIDLRGTGESNPLNCPGIEAITTELSDKEALDSYHSLMENCAVKFEKNAPFYSTQWAAADMESIRTRLGYKQFNLWGASYGSRVALKYATEYPAFARSLVLDGLAPRAISLPRFIARDATAAFAKLNEYCKQDHLCKQHYGDLNQNAEKIIQHLQTAENEHRPERISLPDPLNQKPKEWIFTPRRFVQLIISALYSRELTSLTPRALQEAANGNYQLLGTLSALAESNSEQLSIAEGLYYSVICNEDLTQTPIAPLADPFFMGVDLVEDKLAVCTHWPKAQASSKPTKPTKQINNKPTLLLSGALDPVTPKVWADLVALTQLNHQSIEVPGGNHVVSILGCVPNLIAQFINTPTAHMPADCAQAISPLPFYLGADPAAADNNTANKRTEDLQP